MSLLKTLAPAIVVPAPVASVAWVGHEAMKDDDQIKTSFDEIKNKNNSLNSEFE